MNDDKANEVWVLEKFYVGEGWFPWSLHLDRASADRALWQQNNIWLGGRGVVSKPPKFRLAEYGPTGEIDE